MKLLLSLALLVSACSSGGTPTDARGTVAGRVLSAPSCPVERAGSPCPPRPVVGGTVAAMRAGDVVASTRTRAGGRFQLSLAAGHYVIRATNVGGLATTDEKPVMLNSGATAHVTLVVDSGIR